MRRWQKDDELNHAGVKFPTGSKLHFPTFEVAIVSLVTRISDPQVISAKSGLVLNPGGGKYISILSIL